MDSDRADASPPPPTVPATTTAWRQHRYGGVDAVAAETVDVPQPGPKEVLLAVGATSLNAADAHLLQGEPLFLRLGFGLRRPRHAVRGMDVAGTVVAVGADVSGLSVGDEVVGELPGGGLSEYALAPAERLAHRPAAVSPEDAASLPMAAGTAWQALERAAPEEGDRVLVIGASGGVGTFAVQLAADRGLEVWALTGARSMDLVRGLGASHVFDYAHVQPGSPELPPGSFAAVLEIAGTAPLGALQSLVRPGGRVVLVGGHGGRIVGPLGRMLHAAVRSIGSRRRIRSLIAMPSATTLGRLLDLVATGRMRPVIERTYRLADAPAALTHIVGGRTVGKIVVLSD